MRSSLSKGLQAACLAAAVLFAPHAEAAAPCAIESQAPKLISTSTYVLQPTDECAALLFTNGSGTIVTVNAPVAAGYSVAIIPGGAGGVTLQMTPPTTLFVNGQPLSAATIPQGAGTSIVADATNYYSLSSSPAAVSGFSNLSASSVYPGTFLSNSAIVPLNGVLQVANAASIVPADRGDIVRACQGVNRPLGAPPSRSSAWWYILDSLQRPYKIPLC